MNYYIQLIYDHIEILDHLFIELSCARMLNQRMSNQTINNILNVTKSKP